MIKKHKRYHHLFIGYWLFKNIYKVLFLLIFCNIFSHDHLSKSNKRKATISVEAKTNINPTTELNVETNRAQDNKVKDSASQENYYNRRLESNLTRIWPAVKRLFQGIIQWIKGFFVKLYTIIKDFINHNILQKKPKDPKEDYESVLVKLVNTRDFIAHPAKPMHHANGVITAEKRVFISIPSRMEGLDIINILPRDVNTVKKGDVLVEFDIRETKMRAANNLKYIEGLKSIHQEEKVVLESGAMSKKEFFDTEAKLEKALGEQEVMEHQIKNAIIFAPFDGVIQRLESPEKGQNSRNKRDLFLLSDPHSLIIEAYLPQVLYSQVLLESNVKIKLSYTGELKLQGKVVAKDPFADNNVGVFKVFIQVKAPNNNHLIGQSVSLKISGTGEQYYMQVPEKAVFFDGGKMCVFIIQESQAVRRNIRIEKSKKGILTITGLDKKATIIVDEANVINNGDIVSPNNSKVINNIGGNTMDNKNHHLDKDKNSKVMDTKTKIEVK
jgi:RND family efflux transporter MFP subunit